VVVVHDAARPCASPALFAAAIAAVARGADAAVPGLALADTVKRVGDDGVVAATLERAGLIAVQTPQAFTADALRGAHGAAGEATDDAALVEAAGGRVVVVVGEVANVKVTVPSDLTAAAGHLAGGAARPPAGIRVGLGFDVHPFGGGGDRPLVLGGVVFAGERGLVGHSDADVVAHAAAEALLGAAGLDDLGTQFPDTDPRWMGADSLTLLATVAGLVRDAGWDPANVDCSVVLDGPKLAPRRRRVPYRSATAPKPRCESAARGRSRFLVVIARQRPQTIVCGRSTGLRRFRRSRL
jgi:2-C-methyl-D-erythritol 2,4-cyclodiphosphate synthase